MADSLQFNTLSLKADLLRNLGDLGYAHMTMVQAETLPVMLAGKDVLARAKTGSGKTAAFGLSLLNQLDPALFRVQALVLCPTRELAEQVAGEIRRLARPIPNIKILSLCGGVPIGPQTASLQHQPHVIVGTPGRLLKHLRSGAVALADLAILVLDEADRLLDMGFADELEAILAFVPAKRQTLLFSATYPPEIASMSARVQRKAVRVDVTEQDVAPRIEQCWCAVSPENRQEHLRQALRAWGGELNLVFCNTKKDCAEVAGLLRSHGVAALALHGDLDQADRTEVLVRFANRSASVLVATDVAARGLDVNDLNCVVNYELPKQPEVYVHRIGRTARAGKAGIAVSLVEPREQWRLADIKRLLPEGVLQQREIPTGPPAADVLTPTMTTIQISGGRKNKLRPGDLLGALTAAGGVPGDAVGAIDLFANCGYVAVRNQFAKVALRQLADRPIKGRRYRARIRK
jgi:ATP-independent RNA helicase DbpA